MMFLKDFLKKVDFENNQQMVKTWNIAKFCLIVSSSDNRANSLDQLIRTNKMQGLI